MNHLLIKAGILFSSLFLVGCEDNTPPQSTVQPQDTSVVAPATENNHNDVTTGTATSASFPQAPQEGITAEEAKAIALEHAGVAESEVKFVTTEFEYEKGVPEWEIEFYVGNLEYDYDIHALTGEILSFDQEIEFGKTETLPDITANGYLSQDAIKDIILDHAGVNLADISRLQYDFEMEKGVPEYEVEFYVGAVEYDYEINALTGEILSFSQEGKNNSSGTTGTTADTGDLISEADAKAIVLKHAGVSEADISRYSIKFQYDDRMYQYEIDFYVGKTEYEYDVNAVTGDILSFEQDRD